MKTAIRSAVAALVPMLIVGVIATAGFSEPGRPMPIPEPLPTYVDDDLPPGASVPFTGQLKVAELLPVIPLWSTSVEDGTALPVRIPNPLLADPASVDAVEGKSYCPKGADCQGHLPSN